MLSLRGDITLGAVSDCINTDIETYFKLVRDNDWTGIRQFIADISIPWNDFYSVLFNNIENYIEESFVSEAIVLIAKYQYEAAYVVDKQIPLAALAIEMMNAEYKKDF